MIDSLFGKCCYIDTPWIAGKHTIYRIIRSGVKSNSWCEVPVNGLTKKVNHGEHSEEIVFVMLDTLIDEDTKIMRFALKDVEIIEMADRKSENSSEIPNNCKYEDIFEYCPRCGMRMLSKWYEPKTEPQTEYDKYREKIRAHDPHKDWFEDEPQTDIGTSDTVYSDTAGYVPRADITDCSWKKGE